MHYIISYILILVSYVHVCYHTVEEKRAKSNGDNYIHCLDNRHQRCGLLVAERLGDDCSYMQW